MGQATYKSCLIVDESGDARAACSSFLKRHAFDIREAGDGREALAMCRSSMPDLIVVGSHMPNMTGLQFLRRLRRSRSGAGPVVLFCPASGDAGEVGAAISVGASECLMTPFDADILDFKLVQSGLI